MKAKVVSVLSVIELHEGVVEIIATVNIVTPKKVSHTP